MKGHLRKLFVFMGFLACGMIPPLPAWGASFETAFNNLKTLSEAAGPALKALFLVSGIVFLGLGIFKWVQSSKRDEPKGPAITMIVAGVLLLGIWTFASTLAETLGISVDANFG